VASTGPWAVGGLAAYARNLLNHLPDSVGATYSARFVTTNPGDLGLDYAAREPPATSHYDGVPVSTVVPRSMTMPALALSRRFVHYRQLHRVAAAAAVAAWRPALQSTVGPDPSVIHAIGCGRELLGYAALAEARRRGIPFTVTPALHINSWGDSELDFDLYKRAQAVFALTLVERDHLERHGIAASRLFVCGPGPDCPMDGNGERFRQTHGLADRPIVLFVGRKSRGKGYHELRQAMPAVAERVPGAMLVAIGVDAEPPYPDLSSSLLLDLGVASDETKADALAACTVMCLPSDSESFGIVYVEAWAYAKPVVALDTTASRALIDDGTTGVLVADRRSGLVDTLSRLLSDPASAARMGRAGHATYAERYTWQAAVATHMRVFATVIRRAEGAE
jgi:glycosyltransferase involved in cell wall biosynthesis